MRPLIVITALLVMPLASQPALGEIYVDRTPDRAFALVMRGVTFNGFTYPQTPLLEAAVGEVVQFAVTIPPGVGEAHTFHLHGHPWFVPDKYGLVDTVLLQPGDVYSFSVIAGSAAKADGDWMYHCHFDEHMSAGMWGIFRVYPFGVKPNPVPGGLAVKLDRMGAPVDGASFHVTLDGAPVATHATRVGAGDYVLHAPGLHAASGVVVVTATTALGESVARLGLGGAVVPPPTITMDHPAGATSHAH